MFVSSDTNSTLAAFASSLVLLLAILGPAIASSWLPGLAFINSIKWLSGPLQMLFYVPESSFFLKSHLFWQALAGAVVASLVLFGAAGALLYRFPCLEPVSN